MPAVLYDRPSRPGPVPAQDSTVTACLMWVAQTLVRVAGTVADPRSAGVLVEEAAAVLASVPRPRPEQLPVQPLTGRELAVLSRLQEEVPLRQIADGMYVSHNTVKSHVRSLYRKLGASSRAQAVARGRALGLLTEAGVRVPGGPRQNAGSRRACGRRS
ncbi:LuxR C-terminal-related transcriptional regulator [Streptomyces sp. VRA16 Mangrove soil]|uniref:LuxR C-terminal-related transcriptional regulator n=1 Tax=Streptomyces sp. VRA16 Mangrove soil TaxID=2817434 RepID=UPI001A9CDBDD|nr:LuxR C-terminal-related transcriptional regulator [Streptomyces sp. VRA16 Mangrove soil]MBO1332135.1 response regulator transcription factor [Streptomyces sp. VRA16 Mangrove soil]